MTSPAVRWTSADKIQKHAPWNRGMGARQHAIWSPIFTQLQQRPGCFAEISREKSRQAAQNRVRSLRRYLEKTRGKTLGYMHLQAVELCVYCRYLPPSYVKRKRK